jgi:hypothetical protein
MTISDHITTFAGLPVVAYPDGDRPGDPATVAWRIEDPEYDGGEVFTRRLADLQAEPWADQVVALVVGSWGSTYDTAAPVGTLAEAAQRFTAL